MRTKEEIAAILSKKKLPETLAASTWSDLVASIQVFSSEEKDIFVKLIATGNPKKAGERLRRALHKNAEQRAQDAVNTMLSDDSLSLAEIDSLI